MFKIISCGGAVEPYLEKCLESVLQQRFTDWELILSLDYQGDKSFDIAKKYASEKIKTLLNDTPKYSLQNMCDGIRHADPGDEDILVFLDADDRLPACDDSLDILYRYYDGTDTLVTHGSFLNESDMSPGFNCPYMMHENVRRVLWKASHLRTIKYKVWKNIKDEDLRDDRGEYLIAATDLATMFPAIEMAGHDRTRFIPEIMHIYNDMNPQSDGRVRKQLQLFSDLYVRNKRSYQRMAFD